MTPRLAPNVLVAIDALELVECRSWPRGEEDETMPAMRWTRAEVGAGGNTKEGGWKSVTGAREAKCRKWKQRRKRKAEAEGRSARQE